MAWTKEKPDPIDKGDPSVFYWYWDIGDKEPWVVQIYPNRNLYTYNGYWWDIPIDKPLGNPYSKKDVIVQETVKPPKPVKLRKHEEDSI